MPAKKAAKDWGVNLYRNCAAKNPADAVNVLLENTLQVGLANYTYSVKDLETGEIFFVEGGTAYTEEDFGAKLAAEADEADEDAGNDEAD